MPSLPQRSQPAAQHIARFFALYPNFVYDPQASVSAEFRRLVATHRWKRQSPQRDEAWERFSKAMGQQFSTFYGSDINDLRAWQALCIALRVKLVPDTVKECKKIIKSTHVNLVDFIDTRTTGRPIKKFRTAQGLRDYTNETEKYFPLESAKESGVLKYLLRQIL
ncbi:hypothetical protein M378DRAFT_159246 [Amanita muscaria Koide BX008]|uniref:Uncharacterized protein n=1 Tax=Amanita muscaria (strain Koide BX008) TaxID=946122 RepID=A0A0C2XGH7_AMAMK|nr:hypothetical protein M378DRAFT_159246 [Amanita muscaria Koide BX008]